MIVTMTLSYLASIDDLQTNQQDSIILPFGCSCYIGIGACDKLAHFKICIGSLLISRYGAQSAQYHVHQKITRADMLPLTFCRSYLTPCHANIGIFVFRGITLQPQTLTLYANVVFENVSVHEYHVPEMSIFTQR